MKIIKSDIKAFFKPMIIYIIVTQVLLAISFNLTKITYPIESVIMQYFIIFVTTICVVAMVAMTILFAIYFNTKSNSNHREMIRLTDGYGLYRFVTTIKFLLVVIINFVIGFMVWGTLTWQMILNIGYEYYTGSLFFFIPLLTLVVLSIAHTRDHKIFRNIEMMISLVAILLGLYLAGNLYYFSNQQQGSAVLFLLFIPLAISYMSIKESNSQRKIYKGIIWLMCASVTLISLGLVVTSEFSYDTNDYNEPYEPEYYSQSEVTNTELVDTDFGQLVITTGSNNEGLQDSYALTTDKFTYRLLAYSPTEIEFSAYQLDSATNYRVSAYEGMTEEQIYADIYDQVTNKHTQCSTPISEVGTHDDCQIDSEIIEVYKLMSQYVNEQSTSNSSTIAADI